MCRQVVSVDQPDPAGTAEGSQRSCHGCHRQGEIGAQVGWVGFGE